LRGSNRIILSMRKMSMCKGQPQIFWFRALRELLCAQSTLWLYSSACLRREIFRSYWGGIGLSGLCLRWIAQMAILETYVFPNQYLGGNPRLSAVSPRHIHIMEISLARFFDPAIHTSEYLVWKACVERTDVSVVPCAYQNPAILSFSLFLFSRW
jgi:hypothetical protein